MAQSTQLGVGSGADEALRYKFRGIGGGELLLSSTFDTHGTFATYNANGTVFHALTPSVPGGMRGLNARMSYFGDEKSGGLPVPKTLRYVRYPEDAQSNPEWRAAQYRGDFPKPYLGAPIVDVIVPVASRIPDEVLDRIRKYKGGLILKLRLTPETILVGWQMQNGKSYPWRTDANGRAYATDEDVMIGGDFCEKQVVYRMIDGKVQQVRRKGWQIDPNTGQRIETDF